MTYEIWSGFKGRKFIRVPYFNPPLSVKKVFGPSPLVITKLGLSTALPGRLKFPSINIPTSRILAKAEVSLLLSGSCKVLEAKVSSKLSVGVALCPMVIFTR